MAYTPNADFEFSTGYTPTVDFDFLTAPTYNLAFGQSWTLEAPSIDELDFGQQWSLDAQTYSDFSLGQGWTLAAADFADLPFDQQWTLDVHDYANSVLLQLWAVSAPTMSNTYLRQKWSLSSAAFADIGLDQSWAIEIPEFDNTAFNQSWSLLVFEYGNASVDQEWAQNGLDGVADLAFRQRWVIQATAIWTKVVSSVTYTLALTGEADSTTDINLPIASYSSRLRSGESSYLQVSVPNARLYAAEIAARQHGDLVISRGTRWSDGTVDVEEIARATLSLINTDIGGSSSTASLQARATTTNVAPKTVTLTGAHYKASSGGRRRYRCPIDNSLRPGDTVVIDGDSLLVDQLSHYVSTKQGYMEIAEA